MSAVSSERQAELGRGGAGGGYGWEKEEKG